MIGRVPIVLSLLVIAAVPTAAQLRVDVGLVNVVATVVDDRGNYVADLAPEDFVVYEDGEPQAIDHFVPMQGLPVSVGVLLDTSRSMESKIETATDAVEQFLHQIHPDDDVFLITFGDRPELLRDFTDDRDRLARALQSPWVGGGTALYEALTLGVDHIRGGRHENKAILLISDGEDTSSSTSLERILRELRQSDLRVYSLGLGPGPEGAVLAGAGATRPTISTGGPIVRRTTRGIPRVAKRRSTTPARRSTSVRTTTGTQTTLAIRRPTGAPPRLPAGQPAPGAVTRSRTVPLDRMNMEVLELFGTISGGWARRVSGSSENSRRNQVSEALEELADELRSQYSIGYYPPHSLDDGIWHRIEITTRNPAHRVRYREQYFGGPEPE